MTPEHLTIAQAADELNVSEGFVERLLASGEIASQMNGNHFLIRADWVEQYKREDDVRRRAAADELMALEQELGLH
jgi:excisionase family DNA binding protein